MDRIAETPNGDRSAWGPHAMDRYRARPEADAITFEASRGSKRLAVLILVPILLVASIAVLRASGVTTRPSIFLTGAAKDMAPAELASTAADAFELATAVGGPGYTFEVVQHATLVARSEGPPIDDPDPASPEKAAETGSQVAGSYIERGTATPDGFHAEIRRGPDDPRAPPDWTANDLELAALVRGGKTYRNDGAGWYATTRPPGLGLDPATADLLPTMLRQLTDPTDVTAPEPDASVSPDSGRAKTDPFAHLSPSRRLEGHTKIADIPGNHRRRPRRRH